MKYDEFYKLCEKVYEPITNFEKSCLPLCAAENEQSEFTKIPLKSFIQDKYIMGGIEEYQEHNNFIGSNNLFELYNLLNRLSSELFKSMYADGRTLTGVNTISLLLMSLFKNNDKILISDEECGGHSSMPKLCKRLGIKTCSMPYDYNNYDFDYEKLNTLLLDDSIKGILICQSDMIFQPKLEKIKMDKNKILIYDATQVLGLIASKKIRNYLEFFDSSYQFIMAGSTHKTLPGPTNGLILTNSSDIINKIDLKINPDYLRNVQLHQIMSLIFTLEEFSIFGKEYCEHMVKVANMLGKLLEEKGINIVKKDKIYTETHQIFILMDSKIVDKFIMRCQVYKITLNARKKQIYNGSGIRIGTQLIARYGWNYDELKIISEVLYKVYLECIDENTNYSNYIISEVKNLSKRKMIKYTFEENIIDLTNKLFKL